MKTYFKSKFRLFRAFLWVAQVVTGTFIGEDNSEEK